MGIGVVEDDGEGVVVVVTALGPQAVLQADEQAFCEGGTHTYT